jgi:hypothetical protein
VSIPHLAQAVMAIALQRPNDARARPSSLLKRDTEYETVFNIQYPISLYLVCANLMKIVDGVVRTEKYRLNRKDQTNLRFYAAMYLAGLLSGKVAPTPQDVATITVTSITDAMLDESKKNTTH